MGLTIMAVGPEVAGVILHGGSSMWVRRAYFGVVGLMEFVRGGLLLVLLPTHLREQLHLSLSTVGFALSAFALTELSLKLPAGMLVDRAGRRAALIAGVAVSIAALLVLGRAKTVGMILLGSALFGAGAAPIWPAVVSGVTPQDSGQSAAMGGVFTAWLAGTGLGAASIAQLLAVGTPVAFLILTSVAGLALLGVIALVPAERGGPRKEFTGAAKLPMLVQAFRQLHPLLLGMFFQTFAMGMLVPILVPYARGVLHLSPARLALLFAAGPGLAVVLLLPLGRLADKLGPTRVVAGGVLLAPLGPLAIPACGGLLCLLPLAAGLGAIYALILPAWNAVLLSRIPEQNKGLIVSFAMALEGLGGAVGPTSGGQIADLWGLKAPFYAAAVAFVAIALLYFYFLKYKTQRTDTAL